MSDLVIHTCRIKYGVSTKIVHLVLVVYIYTVHSNQVLVHPNQLTKPCGLLPDVLNIVIIAIGGFLAPY